MRKIYSRVPTLYSLLTSNSVYKYRFNFLGADSFIHNTVQIHNPSQLTIKNSVTIQRDSWINSIKGDNNEYGEIILGNEANLGRRCTLSAARKIEVGDNVLFGMNVYIADHEHEYKDINVPIMYQDIKIGRGIEIKKNSWIGANVVITSSKQKIEIGEHCVIGANSVVKESIPAYSMAVGSPAKIILQYNFKREKWEKISK